MTISITRIERYSSSEDDDERCYNSHCTTFSKDRFLQYALTNGLIHY
jgi:hypothetical protein